MVNKVLHFCIPVSIVARVLIQNIPILNIDSVAVG